ncbi:MAG TPA: acyl carrier protein [Gemmatimonadaceae bacterium]
MTRDEIKSAVLAALRRVAPEVDPASLRGDVSIRDQVDLDSMDFLNFMLELHAALGVDVPEASYKDVATLDGCIAYVAAHNPQALAVKHGDR